jgi:hypothetical protein
MSRCPAKVFGLNPSVGCSVYSFAVMSLDVVMKNLEDFDQVMEMTSSWCPVYTR